MKSMTLLRISPAVRSASVRPTAAALTVRRGFCQSARRTDDHHDGPLAKTPLYDFHVSNQAKMVPFAGYSMPLSYGDVGQVTTHKNVRDGVGLFDVSHMVPSYFRGESVTDFLEWLTPSDLQGLAEWSSTLSVLLNEEGGIVDDTIICKHDASKYYVVTNAGRREEDLAHFAKYIEIWNSKHPDAPVSIETLEGHGLVALQGPKAAEYLQPLIKDFDLNELKFGMAKFLKIDGVECHVARSGYTGEDGFEILIPPASTVEVTSKLSQPPVLLTGLGARDSLRLEAGMCLYGQDLNESITPIEAGLAWVVGKSRRVQPNNQFIGASKVLSQLASAPPRRRVGLLISPGSPAREGTEIYGPDGTTLVGKITSGIPSPSLNNANIAMGYVENGYHKKGTELKVLVRKKMRDAKVSGMPFVKTNYFK